MTARLSHLNDKGEARMVDVSAKEVTSRTARAEGFVAMAPGTLELILAGKAPKGDVLATARIAGIMAAKRTHELIPLCHALPLSEVAVDFEPSRDRRGVNGPASLCARPPSQSLPHKGEGESFLHVRMTSAISA